MSDRYDGGQSSRRRGVFTHWVPLMLTLTIATAGVAAWVWSQRKGDDEYEDEDGDGIVSSSSRPGRPGQQQRPYTDLDYNNADYGDNPPYGASTPQPGAADPAGSAVGNPINMTESPSAAGVGVPPPGGWGARMSGALGGTTSPQQWVGSASKAVTASFTAASAAVGGALASLREDDKDAYADHETWSEEADARKDRRAAKDSAGRKRKTVAIVVSSEHYADVDEDGYHEQASILSHIPRQNDFSRVRIFVLVYAPGLKDAASLDPATPASASFQQPNSLSSSFSNIGPDGLAQSPRQDAKISPSSSVAYSALHAQALGLVEKDTEIIPFTSPNGHAHVLHLLEPDIVYLQESLAGDNGATVNQIQNWMRNDIVVVVGAESGHGGLADSESEAEKPSSDAAPQKWWQRDDRVGRGRGVVVVDGLRVNDDWVRRVQGKE